MSTGNKLQIKVVSVTSANSGASIVFPRSLDDVAPRFYNLNQEHGFVDALDAGAYLYAGMDLHLSIEAQGSEEVLIDDIRIVDVKSESIVTGSLIQDSRRDESARRIHFNLDDKTPIAWDVEINAPVFVEPAPIPYADTVTASFLFVATKGAYTFNIAFDYSIWGRRYTQVLTRNGDPFRVTAALCPLDTERARLSAADRQRLADMRYFAIRRRIYTHNYEPLYLSAVNPESYAQSCWSN